MSTKLIRFSIIGVWLIGSSHGAISASQGAPDQTVWSGVYSTEQSKRGETLYAAQCASCHGPMLEGREMAPPLTGGRFNSNWNGLTLADLADRIRVSMPQNNPGTLSRQQSVDIIAFILTINGFPVGMSDLPREAEALKGIVFETTKR